MNSAFVQNPIGVIILYVDFDLYLCLRYNSFFLSLTLLQNDIVYNLDKITSAISIGLLVRYVVHVTDN